MASRRVASSSLVVGVRVGSRRGVVGWWHRRGRWLVGLRRSSIVVASYHHRRRLVDSSRRASLSFSVVGVAALVVSWWLT
ncbi:hypothetical protein ACXZ9C_11905 [Streptococcus agalactiae]